MTQASRQAAATPGEKPLEPPGSLLALLELRAPLEAGSLLLAWPWLARMPRGDGRPVLLAPGYGAGDASMAPLHRYLTWLGYDAQPWGLGRNRGKVLPYVQALRQRLRDLQAVHGTAAVSLIGWSLGGIIAREVAREEPSAVREVITLGTPVVGGPKYTRVGSFFAWRENVDPDRLEREIHLRNLKPIQCPLTCVYSTTDGIVAWRASIDRYNAQVRHVRVPGSHLGLALNPLVWRVIAKTLAGRNDA